MKMYLYLLVIALIWAAHGQAAPSIQVQKIAEANLSMSTNDALQNKPFEFEGGEFYLWKGVYIPAPFGLTDAASAVSPVDDVLSSANPCYRFDLGSMGPNGRRLDSIKIWWTMDEAVRNGVKIKVAAHNIATLAWTDITGVIEYAGENAQPGYYKVLTITFPANEVTNFDSLRVYDLRAITTRFIEIEAFTTPNNR